MSVTADNATLDVTEGSMTAPDGSGDVAMTANDPGDMLGSYDMEPTGAEFYPPAQLTVRAALDAAANETDKFPMVLLVGSSTEVPIRQAVASDHATSAAVLTADIPHFSTALVDFSPFSSGIDDPGDNVLGAAFDVNSDVSIADDTKWELPDGSEVSFSVLRWQLENVVWKTGPRLTPLSANEPGTDDAKGSVKFKHSFQCAQAGVATVGLTGRITWTGTVHATDGDHTVTDATIGFATRSQPFDCLEEEPTPPASAPTSTPTATPITTPTTKPTTTPAPADMVEAVSGVYEGVRSFDTNTCGYTSYDPEITVRAADSGEPNAIYFGMVDEETPYLSHMDYVGAIQSDGTFQAAESGPDLYNAEITGTFDLATHKVTFGEAIKMLRPDSPCKGKSFTTTGNGEIPPDE